MGEFLALMEDVDLPEGTSIYTVPDSKISPPAIVLRPDTPWIEQSGYCYDEEHYLAIAVVQASTPSDGIPLLRSMTLAIIGALTPPWDWVSADGPVVDNSTGIEYLANRLRLKYRNGGP